MLKLSAPSTPSRAHHQHKDRDEDMAPDRRPGPCLCLCLCFTGQQELSVRQDRRGEGGMPWGLGFRMWEGG